jgi:hypothetical protein
MPSARAALAAAALDRKIYVVGGSPLARERDFAAYDPALDEWDPLPPMPSPRNHLAAGAAGRRIYAVGGRSGGIAGISAALEAFDVDTGLWQPLEPMPTARGGIAAAVVGHFLIVYGGEGNPDAPAGTFEEVEAFDTQTGDWLALSSMVTPRHGIGAARVGGRVHVPGGGPVEGFGVSEVHEIHDPLEDLALDVPLLAPVARALIALLLLVTVAGGAVSRWRAPASLRSASSPPRSRPSSWP